jgi:hypothetical protein
VSFVVAMVTLELPKINEIANCHCLIANFQLEIGIWTLAIFFSGRLRHAFICASWVSGIACGKRCPAASPWPQPGTLPSNAMFWSQALY